MSRAKSYIFTIIAISAASACSRHTMPRVPAEPPNNVSEQDINQNYDAEWRAPVDVFAIAFRPNTPVGRKQNILDEVRGVVIGGHRPPISIIPQGYYFVRV